MKRLIPIIAAVILAGIFIHWWTSPAQVLKRRTQVMLQTLTLKPGTSAPARQVGLYTFSAMLAPDVTLESAATPQANGEFPRSELESVFCAFCEQAKQTRFDVANFDSVTVRRDEADVVMTVNAMVEIGDNRPIDGSYRVSLRWQNPEGNWLITRASWEKASH